MMALSLLAEYCLLREREREREYIFDLRIGVGLVGAPFFGIVCEPMDIWVHNLVG